MTPGQPYTASTLYPSPSEASLKLQFLGKQIKDVQAPAAIIDAAVVRRNCKLMLDTAEKLGCTFRAHVKTHKTKELSELQVGKDSKSVRLVASTLSEIEHLAPWLYECKSRGKEVSVFYGLPLSLSAVSRLAAIARVLGEGTVGIFADHPTHVKVLDQVDEKTWPGKIPVFFNVDVGYHREGVAPDSKQLADVAYAMKASKRATLAGVYTHFGSSYGVSSPEEALKAMAGELQGLEQGAIEFLKCTGADISSDPNAPKVVLSLGASPTATAIQNLLEGGDEFKQYRAVIENCQKSFEVEFHAGVYPVMDMQQLATRARPQHAVANPQQSLLSFQDLGMRILTEVASVYPEREEVLVASGGIVFGREPCKSYPGWGVVTPWPASEGQVYDPETSKTGWIIARIAQEHGNLTWEGPKDNYRELQVGDKLLVWPNHACIASANFGWYLVVDSDKPDPERIDDVWVRWRGW
ncbi:hypothetical protein M409DRAFT_55079 [Zasmidium cellare ATCC 36951]|uniref:D-serine dehydratase-like domain-containing protein n=1 Tax=Zasmidium cellare ATCC 36951 TaxID=1080233 RepID=A0A6A6CGC7_ZASCE|nr:uncharacterized protein M409DRAFT_55079 [Zasmidium cellare ATCC 36951]KAF2166215.1 hypothetical protein M409DRAFT_55079 [Zasmidium cellare ATCC 36951]